MTGNGPSPSGTRRSISSGLSPGRAYSIASYVVNEPARAATAVTPSSAPPAGGTKISISGTGFTTALNSSITVGGVPATNVQVIDAVTMMATVPAHAAGAADVVVNVGGTAVTLKNAFAYLANEPRHRSVKH